MMAKKSEKKIKTGDKVQVKSTGYQGVIADIQYEFDRYQLTDVSNWQYGIANIEQLVTMFEWQLAIKGEDRWGRGTVVAETAGKAKYKHFQDMREFWDVDFQEFLKYATCCKVGPASAKSFFGNKEQFERTCIYRNIPYAYQGMRIEVAGKMGTIVGSNNSCNLDVVFDGRWYAENCHPWWETRYFDEAGNVIKDYREKQVDKDRMAKEQARQNVASFVATREYTYTVDQVVDNYQTYYKNGSYISHSMKDCVKHLEAELEVLSQ